VGVSTFGDVDPLHGGSLVAARLESLVKLLQVLIEILGVLLSCLAVDTRGSAFLRPAEGLLEKINVDVVRECPQRLTGSSPGQFRYPPKFR
jgi:hypothetical protein